MTLKNVPGLGEMLEAREQLDAQIQQNLEERRAQLALEDHRARNAHERALRAAQVATQARTQQHDDESAVRTHELDQLTNSLRTTGQPAAPAPTNTGTLPMPPVDPNNNPAAPTPPPGSANTPPPASSNSSPTRFAGWRARTTRAKKLSTKRAIVAILAALATFILAALLLGWISNHAHLNGGWAQNGFLQFMIALIAALGVGILLWPESTEEVTTTTQVNATPTL